MQSKNQKNWYVYIAQAKTGRFYVGITTDIQARTRKHDSGRGSMFATEQGPFELVYCSGAYPDKSEARKREIQLKGWSRTKKQKLISGEYK